MPVNAVVSTLRPSFQNESGQTNMKWKTHILSVLWRRGFHRGFQWPVLSSSGLTVQAVSPLSPHPRPDHLQRGAAYGGASEAPAA